MPSMENSVFLIFFMLHAQPDRKTWEMDLGTRLQKCTIKLKSKDTFSWLSTYIHTYVHTYIHTYAMFQLHSNDYHYAGEVYKIIIPECIDTSFNRDT